MTCLFVISSAVGLSQPPEVAFSCANISGGPTENYGAYLTSHGAIRALVFVIKFSDDNFNSSPYTDDWHSSLNTPATFPSWVNNIVSSSSSPPFPYYSISGWYHTMSHGNLTIYGDVYKYVPQQVQSYYNRSNGRGMGFLHREILDYFDSTIDYSIYDSVDPMDIDDDQNYLEPDGNIDLVLFLYRFIDTDNLVGVHCSGIASIDYFQDVFKSSSPIVRDGKTFVGGSLGSGVTARLNTKYFLYNTFHEVGHYFWGNGHWGEGLSGYGNKFGFNAFEQAMMGWITPTVITSSTIDPIYLDDLLTTGEAIKIPIPGTNEFFMVENRQKSHLYDDFRGDYSGGPPLFKADPGILVIHASNNTFSATADVECADGKFSYTFPPYPPVVGSPNPSNGYDEIELFNATGGSYGNSGNFNDTWKEGYNTVFSPYSNPNTKYFYQGTLSNVAFEVHDVSDGIAELNVFVGNAANASPSKPQAVTAQYNTNNQVAVSWVANQEPDVLTGGGYDLYRALYWSGGSLSYTKLNAALLTSSSFVDNPTPPGGIPNDKDIYYRYHVKAKDSQGLYSNASEDFWLYLGKSTSGAIGSSATWNQNRLITSSVTINNGITVTISSGVTVRSMSGASITCNGVLNANGSTFTSSSGTWNGIVVNSSGSANIQYCNISNAGTGIHLNGVNSAQTIKYCNITNITNYGIQISNSGTYTDISYNTISGPSYCIYLNNANVQPIHQNTLTSSYSGCGIYGYNSGGQWRVTNNIISAYTAFYANYYSTLYLLNTMYGTGGHNETTVGSVSLLADYNSNIEAGGYGGIQGQNSFYGGGIDAQVVAVGYSNVIARNNWWNYDFSYIVGEGSSVDMSNPLASDPNGGFGSRAAPVVPPSLSGSTPQDPPSNLSFLDDELNTARQKMAEGDYEEAIILFSQKYISETNLARKRYALAQVADCYKRAQKRGFIDFLNSEIRPSLEKTDDLYVESLELEAISLVGDQRYPEAAALFEGIKADYSGKEEAYKHALFNLVNLHYSQLGEKAKAEEYAGELKAKHPNDYLTWHARVLLGEEDVPIPGQGVAEKETDGVPTGVSLDNYPNPFNPVTNIRFSIPEPSFATLKVYDLLGREIAVLVNEEKQPGIYSIPFDASNVPTGVYFYHLTAGGTSIIKKMAVVK